MVIKLNQHVMTVENPEKDLKKGIVSNQNKKTKQKMIV